MSVVNKLHKEKIYPVNVESSMILFEKLPNSNLFTYSIKKILHYEIILFENVIFSTSKTNKKSETLELIIVLFINVADFPTKYYSETKPDILESMI